MRLQSIVQDRPGAVCRPMVRPDACRRRSQSTLEIETPVFQHQTDAISDKRQPNHPDYLLRCANCAVSAVSFLSPSRSTPRENR